MDEDPHPQPAPGTFSFGDPLLDLAERELEQELREYEEKLQRIKYKHSQHQTHTLETLEQNRPYPALRSPARAGGAPVVGQRRASLPARRPREQDQPQQQAGQASIVRRIVACTGQGCRAVLLPSAGAQPGGGACWTTRSHRLVTMESSVTLELQPPALHQDVCVRLVFAEPAAVPMLVRIEHGVSPAAKFEALGEIRLQPKSLRQLRHLFRLGRHVAVGRCLRITGVGWLVPQHAGMHRVRALFVTGEPARQDLHSGQHRQVAALGGGPLPRPHTSMEPDANRQPPRRRCSSALAEVGLQQEDAVKQPVPDGADVEAARSSQLGTAQLQYTVLGPHNAVSLGQQTLEPGHGCSQATAAGTSMQCACPDPPGVVSCGVGDFAVAAAVCGRPEQRAATAAAAVQTEPVLLAAGPGMQVDVPRESTEAGQPQRPNIAACFLAKSGPTSHQQEGGCASHLVHLLEAQVQQPAPPAVTSEAAAMQPASQSPSVAPTLPPPPPPPPKLPGATAPSSNAASPAVSPAKKPPPPPPRPPTRTPGKEPAAPVPPSPPPRAAAGSAGQQSPQRTPKRPMVKLFWQKLPPNQVQGTVWSSPQLKKLQAEVDYEALEDDFAAKATVKVSPCKVPRGAMLLALKRCNNVGIVLKKLKLSPRQVKESVLKLLGEDFSEARDLADEEIASLLPCLPTQEEEALLRSYKGNVEELGVVEHFMLGMLEIPSVGPRLEALRFAAQFDSKAAWLEGLANLLSQACQEVRECSQLTEILRVALAVGNFLNAGNSNGCAAGFQVDSLLKLKDVKSTRSRSSTLLHFLAREVARQQPGGVCSLKSCLPSCKEASKLTLGVLHADLAEISAGLKEVEGARSLGSSAAAFAAGMQTFLSRARKKVEQLTARLSGAEDSFRDLGNFLNGQRGTMKEPAAFFQVLATFSDDFDRALAQNTALDEAATKKAEQGQGGKKPSSSRLAAASGRLESSASPMRQKDKVLSAVRAYRVLKPDQRKSLLTDKGAVERLNKLKIKRRHSVAAEHMPHGANGSPAAVIRPHYVPEVAPAFRSRPASPVVVQMPQRSNRRPGTSPAVLQPAATLSGAITVPPTSVQPAASRRTEESQPTWSTTAPGPGPDHIYAPPAGPVMKCIQEPMRYSKSVIQNTGAFGSDILGLSSSSGGDTIEGTSCSLSQGCSRLTSGGSALAAVAGDAAQLQLSISASVGSVPARGTPPAAGRTSAPVAAAAPSTGSSPFSQSAAPEQLQVTPKGLAVCELSHLYHSGSLRSLGALSPTSTPLAAMGSRRSSATSLAPAALWRSASASDPFPPGESLEEQMVQPWQQHDDIAKAQHGLQDAAPFLSADLDSPKLQLERTPDCFAALAEAVIRESLLGPPTASNWVSSRVEAAGLWRTPMAADNSEADGGWPGAVGEHGASHAAGFDVELLVGMMEGRGAGQTAAANSLQQPRPFQGMPDLGRAPSPADDAACSPFTIMDMLQAVPTPMASQQQSQQQWQQEGSAPAHLQRYDPGVEQAMAAVLASAGSSPTGPLGQGVRASLQELKLLQPGQSGLDTQRRPQSRSNGPPVMPQPLGEGVRRSTTMLSAQLLMGPTDAYTDMSLLPAL